MKNLYGDVEIVGWDRDEVDVYAEKKLPPFREEKIRIYSFNSLKPQIEVKKLENFVQIKAEIQEINKKQVPVNQYIRVPRPIYLKDISCENGNIFISDLYGHLILEAGKGDIHVKNCSGSLAASLNDGVFEASLYDLRKGDTIQVVNQQGDITLALQPQVGARITLEAPKGSIESEFEQVEGGEKEVPVQIGNGGAQIRLSALEGNIHIRKIEKEATMTKGVKKNGRK